MLIEVENSSVNLIILQRMTSLLLTVWEKLKRLIQSNIALVCKNMAYLTQFK